jgi:hypothetical protein
MQTISNSDALKQSILILEEEQAVKGQALKQQFLLTYESLKPINIIRSAVHEFTESPGGIDNIMGTGVGLLTGFLSKKVFVGTSGNLFRKLIGSFLQFGVSNLVANHPDSIKSVGQFIFNKFRRSKEHKPGEEEE